MSITNALRVVLACASVGMDDGKKRQAKWLYR